MIIPNIFYLIFALSVMIFGEILTLDREKNQEQGKSLRPVSEPRPAKRHLYLQEYYLNQDPQKMF